MAAGPACRPEDRAGGVFPPRATRNWKNPASLATAWVPTPRRTQHTGLAAAGLPSMGKIVQEAMAVARLAAQGGWGKEPPPPTILKSPGAIQGQCRSPSPHPQAVLSLPRPRGH